MHKDLPENHEVDLKIYYLSLSLSSVDLTYFKTVSSHHGERDLAALSTFLNSDILLVNSVVISNNQEDEIFISRLRFE